MPHIDDGAGTSQRIKKMQKLGLIDKTTSKESSIENNK